VATRASSTPHSPTSHPPQHRIERGPEPYTAHHLVVAVSALRLVEVRAVRTTPIPLEAPSPSRWRSSRFCTAAAATEPPDLRAAVFPKPTAKERLEKRRPLPHVPSRPDRELVLWLYSGGVPASHSSPIMCQPEGRACCEKLRPCMAIFIPDLIYIRTKAGLQDPPPVFGRIPTWIFSRRPAHPHFCPLCGAQVHCAAQ